MILTPHLLVGAALAAKIHPLALAAILALLSHYLLDAVPHWDYSTRAVIEKRWRNSLPVFLKIFFDFLLGIFVIFMLAKNVPLAFAGAFFAVLPDAITPLFIILFSGNKLLQKHHFLHDRICHWFRGKKIPLLWKLTSQIIIAVLAIWAIL